MDSRRGQSDISDQEVIGKSLWSVKLTTFVTMIIMTIMMIDDWLFDDWMMMVVVMIMMMMIAHLVGPGENATSSVKGGCGTKRWIIRIAIGQKI